MTMPVTYLSRKRRKLLSAYTPIVPYGRAANFPTADGRDNVTFSTVTFGAATTIAMWLYFTGSITNNNILLGAGTQNLRYGSSAVAGKITMTNSTPATILTTTSNAQNDAAWHFLVVTDNGSAIKCYLDNVDMGNSSAYATLSGSTTTQVCQGSNASSFIGKIDEFMIFNRCLSAAELSVLYNNGLGASGDITLSPWNSALTLGYHFDEGYGPAADYSGNGRTGTMVLFASRTTGNILMPLSTSNTLTVARTLTRGVRRYSLNQRPDNGFVPVVTSNLLMFIDINNPKTTYTDNLVTLATKTGDIVYGVKDLSGNNNHWKQTTLAKRATLTVGTRRTLTFPLSSVTYSFTTQLTTIRTVFWAVSFTAVSAYIFLLGDATYYDFHSGSTVGCFDATYSPKIDVFRIDKTACGRGASRPFNMAVVTATTNASAVAGTFSDDRGYTRSLQGSLALLLVYNAVLTTSQISSTEDAIKAYLAI